MKYVVFAFQSSGPSHTHLPNPCPFCISFSSTKIPTIPNPHLPGPIAGEPVKSIPVDKYTWGLSGRECFIVLSTMDICILSGALKLTMIPSLGNCSHCSRLVGKAYHANPCVVSHRGSLRSQEDSSLNGEYLAASLTPVHNWYFKY